MAAKRDTAHKMHLDSGVVVEAPRRTPVRADVDVLVCGAGPAGLGAALAAARQGARVLLCERWGQPGGVWTAGLLNPFFEPHGRGWVVDELVARLEAAGAWRPWLFAHCFDTEVMRATLEAMLTEAGVELLYGTLVADAIVEDGQVRGAILESKAGREAVTAKVCIDATGDGDLAARAGCPYELGREVDGLTQPMTLMFEIRGITSWDQQSSYELFDAMAGAIAEHGLDMVLPIERCNYAPWIINTPAPGTADVQLTHVYRLNPLDPTDLTAGTVACRRQAAQAVEVFRHIPGLEGVTLAATAAALGVREGRRVVGRYRLALDDLQAGCRFPDAVASCAFGVDIHEPAPGAGVPSGHHAAMRPYEIPYRCLLPAEHDGLLLAGRLISGSHEAHASYRVTGTAMALGQAAGLAAAWASAEGCQPAQLPGERLRATLAERGARFLS